MFFSEQLITLIVLSTLIGSFLIGSAADFLNLKHLNHPLPQAFKNYCTPQTYARSQAYLKTTTLFGFISAGTDLAVILIFWFMKGFAGTDAYVRSFDLPPIPTGLLFIGILMGLRLLIALPFNIYATFVIEEKFGFNKTTPLVFLTDLLKSIVLSLIIGGALLSLVLLLFESGGPAAWVLCWGASAVFLCVIQYVVPTWIMPLFNKFTPLEEGPLKTAIFEYARSIDFPLSSVFVMDGSRRSLKSNAFFTGFGKNRRIVLFDTLVKEQSIEELVAVLAHEMGHFKQKHIRKRLILAIVQLGIVFYLLSIFISHQGLFNAFFMDNVAVYAGLVFFGMLYAPIDFFLSLFFQSISRKDEYAADRFAALSMNKSQPLISALTRLSVHNLSNLTPHPFYVFLNYSHPPVIDRITALNRLSHP